MVTILYTVRGVDHPSHKVARRCRVVSVLGSYVTLMLLSGCLFCWFILDPSLKTNPGTQMRRFRSAKGRPSALDAA